MQDASYGGASRGPRRPLEGTAAEDDYTHTSDTTGETVAHHAHQEVRPRSLSDARMTRLIEWQRRLLSAVRPKELLELFFEFGIRDTDISRVVPDVSRRSIRRWRTEGAPHAKATERWEQLDDLRSIVGYLLADGTLDEEGIIAWLRSRQPDLGMRRPLDALGKGDFEKVLEAAERGLDSGGNHGLALVPAPRRSNDEIDRDLSSGESHVGSPNPGGGGT